MKRLINLMLLALAIAVVAPTSMQAQKKKKRKKNLFGNYQNLLKMKISTNIS